MTENVCPGCGLKSRQPHPICLARMQGREGAGARRGEREESRWCNLRGKDVPLVECVNFCPAPEARAVCFMESTSNAIARMTQPQRDAILQHPAIRTPGRRS